MSTPRDEPALSPADQRAMVITGCALVALSAAYITFRVSMVVQGESFPGFWLGPELTIAFLVSFLGAGFTIVAERAEQDRSVLPTFIMLLLGAALGLVVAALVFGTSPFLGAVLLGAGLLLWLIHVLRRRRTAKLLSSGHRATGVVVQVQDGADGTSFYEDAVYTVSFVDQGGVSRVVTGRATFPSGNLPRPGEAVTIWYDPSRPKRHILRRPDAGGAE